MRSYLLCSLVLLLCTCVRAQNNQVVGKSNSQTVRLSASQTESIYNTMFSLSKIRGAESIFDSKLGLVHSPGGLALGDEKIAKELWHLLD